MRPEYQPVSIEQKLGYLVEECGEVLHAVGKTQRWGLESFNPEFGASTETNRKWILREFTDLERACAIVRTALDGSMGGRG
jgi:NTP pyrophosphatase (non-canonical NTP hydrolase)